MHLGPWDLERETENKQVSDSQVVQSAVKNCSWGLRKREAGRGAEVPDRHTGPHRAREAEITWVCPQTKMKGASGVPEAQERKSDWRRKGQSATVHPRHKQLVCISLGPQGSVGRGARRQSGLSLNMWAGWSLDSTAGMWGFFFHREKGCSLLLS